MTEFFIFVMKVILVLLAAVYITKMITSILNILTYQDKVTFCNHEPCDKCLFDNECNNRETDYNE